MFEMLPDRPTNRTRSKAVTGAIVAHVLAAVLFAATSLTAVEPLDPPRAAPLVFRASFVPPPPPPTPPPRDRPPREPVESVDQIEKPAQVQPVLIPPVPPVRNMPPEPSTSVSELATGSDESAGEPTGSGEASGIPDGTAGSSSPDPTAAVSPPPVPSGPIRVSGSVSAPIVVHKVRPRYPPIARAAGVQGTVECEATIDQKGHVVDIRVVSGNRLLHDAAVSAMKQWRYRPGRLNGQPVSVFFTLRVKFSIR